MQFFAEKHNVMGLVFKNRDKLKKYLDKFEDGIELTVEIDRKKLLRSLSQNAYYWVYLKIIEDETGNNSDDLHEYFRRKLLPPVEIKTEFGTYMRPQSTTKLNKVEFGEYLDKIVALTNIPLPDPESVGYISNY